MNELIPVKVNENQEPVVSARMLHEFLAVGTEFRHWFPRMMEYGFIEGVDYTPVIFDHPQNGQATRDFALKLDMSKELCMLQRTEKGKQARQYFIAVEKQYNSPEMIMARALRLADSKIMLQERQIHVLETKNEKMRPLVAFAEAVASSEDSILVREFAKILNQDGIPIGEHRLFEWLREKGYLIRAGASDRNKPTQRSMEMGLMELKTIVIQTPDGNTKIRNTPKITGKGQTYFHKKLHEQKEREESYIC